MGNGIHPDRFDEPLRFENLAAGLSVEQALAAVMDGYGRKKDPWVPPSWREPRLQKLRSLLSDPITADEAEALRIAGSNLMELETIILWLTKGPDQHWDQHYAAVQVERTAARRKTEEDSRRAEEDHRRRREIETQEREHLRGELSRFIAQPLARISGRAVVNTFYDAWIRCEFPPGARLPGGGMGDLAEEQLRDKFAQCFVSGVRAELGNNNAQVQHLSGAAHGLSEAFNVIWTGQKPDERRPLAARLWNRHMLPQANKSWGIEPGDALHILNVKELLLRLDLIPSDDHSVRSRSMSDYYWLLDERPRT